MEVEILVAEVGSESSGDQMFHVLYDGTVNDESGYTVLGGEADSIAERLGQTYDGDWEVGDAVKASSAALSGQERTLEADDLEVAILVRETGRRAFQRIEGDELARLLD